MMKSKKISFKSLMIFLIILILFPVFVIQGYNYYKSFQRRYDQELQTNLEVARATGKLFEEFVSGILRQEASIGRFLAVSKTIPTEDINAILAEIRRQYECVRNFAWISPTGIVLASDFPDAVGFDVSQKPYFSEIKNGSDWHIGGLHNSIVTNEPIFSISRAIRNESGGLLGIVIANLRESSLEREFSFFRTAGAGISIIDSKGMLVYQFPNMYAKSKQQNWFKANPNIQYALNGKEYLGSGLGPITTKKTILAGIPLSFGWVAVASRYESEAIGPIYENLVHQAVFFLLILSAGIILPILLSRSILKSAGSLNDYIDSVTRGNYELDSSYNFMISEFHSLAHKFKKMANQVRLREQDLIKERNILDGIMGSTDVSLAYLDHDFNFVAVNSAYAKSCRKNQDDLIGKNHFDLFPNKENEAIFTRVRNTGETVFHKDKAFEFREQKDGGTTYWDWSLAPIKSGGQIIGLAFALRETTQFKKVQDQLRLQARVLDSMSEGVVVADSESKITYTNRSLDAMFGYNPGELIGKHVSLLNGYSPDENIKIAESTRKQFLSTGSWKGEFCNRQKDGTTFFTHCHISLLDLDEHWKTVAVQIDITEEKKIKQSLIAAREELSLVNEQLEQKVLQRTAELEAAYLQLKSANEQLDWRANKLRALASELTMVEQRVRKQVAKILHDNLQQILAAAKMKVELFPYLTIDRLPKEYDDVIKYLKEAIELSRSLATQLSPPILFQSGITAGLQWLANWMAEKYHFEVQLEVDREFPDISDEIKIFLFESTRELLFNSLKHADVHRATSTLRQMDGQTINLTIADNGSGFDPDLLKNSCDNKFSGFGLFSIMERIQLFGGTMQIDSRPGHGARFSLTIPIGQKLNNAPVATSNQSKNSLQTEQKNKEIRLLIADDHVLFREALRQMLHNEPDIRIVGEAQDGIEVIELATKLNPDFVLMDIGMPEIDGIEATRIIHNEKPDIKIIGLSMYKNEERGEEIRAAGAVDYVCKIESKNQLLETIRASLNVRTSSPDERSN